MPFPSSERAIQFAISLVMSMVAMASYYYVDNFMTLVSEESTLVSSRCSPGYFAHGTQCYPQLGCNDLISDVQVYDEVILGFSSARMIKLAEWKHKKLVKHHSLNNLNMESDFRDHLSLFKEVLHDQLIGYCDAPGHFVFITEYHLHSKASLQHPQELHERLQLCSSYAELLVFLHEKDIVLQFDDEAHFLDEIIISQDPWRLILDDVMLMRSSNSTLNNLDIWMTPEVCNAFLRSKDKHVKVYLSQIHKQCRDKDPDKRPNAGQLVKSYKDVQLKLQLSPSI